MHANVLHKLYNYICVNTAGKLQIILDRRLNQDDSRGLGEAMKDNKITESKFFVMIEQRTSTSEHVSSC